MLQNLTKKKKVIFIILTVIIGLLVGLLIFGGIRNHKSSEGKKGNVLSEDTSHEDGEDESEPYDGNGLTVKEETEDSVESIPWSDTEDSDNEGSGEDANTTSSDNKESANTENSSNNQSEQDSEDDSDGGLDEGTLNTEKEWGSNIS